MWDKEKKEVKVNEVLEPKEEALFEIGQKTKAQEEEGIEASTEILRITKNNEMVFIKNGIELGKLSWNEDKVDFVGVAADSVKTFVMALNGVWRHLNQNQKPNFKLFDKKKDNIK